MKRLGESRGESFATRRSIVAGLGVAVLLATPINTRAEAELVFRIEFKDGAVSQSRIEVLAKRRIKLELHNLGEPPAEFEGR